MRVLAGQFLSRMNGRTSLNTAAAARHLAGQAVFSALAFVWSIAVARVLGVHGKGAVSAILLCAALVGSFGVFGTREGLAFFVGKLGASSIPSLLRLSLLQSSGVAIIGALFGMISQSMGAFALREQSPVVVALAGASAGALVFGGQLQVILIAAGRISAASIGPVLQIAVAILLFIFTCMTVGPSVDAAIVAYIASILIASWFYIWKIRGLTPGAENVSLGAKEYWRYCTRSVPSSVAQFLNYRFDQTVIAATVGAGGLGIYGAAVNVAEVASYPAVSIAAIVLPIASRTEERGQLTRRTLAIGGIVGLFAIAFLWVVGPTLVVKLFGPGFGGASDLIPVLLVAALAGGVMRIAGSLSAGYGRPEVGSISSLGALGVTLIGCIIAIPRFGVLGAAWVSVAAYTVSALIACALLFRIRGVRAKAQTVELGTALVTHVYTDENAGDAGITQGLAELLKDAGYERLRGWSTYIGGQGELAGRLSHNAARFESVHTAVWGGYHDLQLQPGKLGWFRSRFLFSLQAIRGAACFMAPVLCRAPIWLGDERDAIHVVRTAGIVVSKGGGFLYCERTRDIPFLMRMCLPILIAGAYKKRIVLLGQTVGPLRGAIPRWILKRTLLRSNATVLARETSTQELLRGLGLPSDRVFNIPDCAFRLRQFPSVNQTRQVAISVRPWQFHSSRDPARAYRIFIDSIAEVATQLQAQGFEIVLVAQVTSRSAVEDDRVACSHVAEHMEQKPKIFAGPLSPRDWVRFYGAHGLVIATRAHAAIFSICAGTPLIHISYNPKGIGIMRDNDLADLCVPIDTVSPSILSGVVQRVLVKLQETRHRVRARALANEHRLFTAVHFLVQTEQGRARDEGEAIEQLAVRA